MADYRGGREKLSTLITGLRRSWFVPAVTAATGLGPLAAVPAVVLSSSPVTWKAAQTGAVCPWGRTPNLPRRAHTSEKHGPPPEIEVV